jgi:putative ABC transport system permease protein
MIVALALDRIRVRPLAALASAAALTLAVALVSVTLGTKRAVEAGLDEPAALCDLIVGPKGSGTELFLSAALGLLPPRGRVPEGAWTDLAADPRVVSMAPIEVEDNLRGWRVVATTEDHPLFVTSDVLGDFFRTGDRIAVVGSVAANALSLKPGDRFLTAHGIGDGSPPYEVVAIPGPRGYLADRTVFVPAASHRHEDPVSVEAAAGMPGQAAAGGTDVRPSRERQDGARSGGDTMPLISGAGRDAGELEPEANAILVRLATPLDLLPMLREFNELDELTAADPRAETSLLRGWLSATDRYVWAAGSVVIALAALSIVVSMVARAEERKREAAIIRVCGGSIGTAVLVEVVGSAILAGAAGLAGLALGAVLLAFAGQPWQPHGEEVRLAALVLAAGVTASLLTSLQLARLSLDETLRPER